MRFLPQPSEMTCRFLIQSLAFCLAGSLSALSGAESLTAEQVIRRIQKNVGIPWRPTTVDTFKAGDPATRVTGIAVTMMATFDVLQRAAAAGKNLVITHEPTFYSHLDQTATLEQQNDEVLRAKQAFIVEHHMVVWRFHDHWHARKPDGILEGMTQALDWRKFQNQSEPHLFKLPQQSLASLASDVKRKLDVRTLRVVGDPSLMVSKIGFMPGAAGSPRHIAMLERPDVEVLMIGEAPEWETIEYVADAQAAKMPKALIIIGHIPSEQAGMQECTRWLKSFVSEVPVEFVPAREPFWLPK
jgi:putative NIF3 family GTP cyclohydrolase 1 type 2